MIRHLLPFKGGHNLPAPCATIAGLKR